MTATEVLRRLLDERGVEHYDGTESTLWGYEQTSESTGTYRYSADEISDGFVNVWLHHLTPEQAIAATLGSAACHPKPHEQWTTVLLSEIAWDRDDRWPDYLSVAHDAHGEWRMYVPEATPGSCNCSDNCTNSERTGTCHDEGDPSDFCCSACGVRMFTDTSDTYTMIASDGRTIIKRPNYCPNCGAKVIDPTTNDVDAEVEQ